MVWIGRGGLRSLGELCLRLLFLHKLIAEILTYRLTQQAILPKQLLRPRRLPRLFLLLGHGHELGLNSFLEKTSDIFLAHQVLKPLIFQLLPRIFQYGV